MKQFKVMIRYSVEEYRGESPKTQEFMISARTCDSALSRAKEKLNRSTDVDFILNTSTQEIYEPPKRRVVKTII